jgi:hypothetical protein
MLMSETGQSVSFRNGIRDLTRLPIRWRHLCLSSQSRNRAFQSDENAVRFEDSSLPPHPGFGSFEI